MNGAGCPSGWQAQRSRPTGFAHGEPLLALGDPVGARRHGAQAGRLRGHQHVRRRRARASPGSRSSRHGTARNGTYWRCRDVRDAVRELPAPTSRSRARGARPRRGSAAWRRAGRRSTRRICGRVSSARSRAARTPRAAGRAVQITHVESHAVVDDYTPPGRAGRSAGSRRAGTRARSSSGTRRRTPGSGVESVHADRRRVTAPHDQPLVLAAPRRRLHAARAVR